MLIAQAKAAIPSILKAETVIVDTETSSLLPWRDGKIIIGLGVRPVGGQSFYLPLRHRGEGNSPMSELAPLVEALRGRELVFHNAKFDLAVLYQEGFDLSMEDVADTMVMARLVYEDEQGYQLESLCYGMLYESSSSHPDAKKKPLIVLDEHAWDEHKKLTAVKMRLKKEYGIKHVSDITYDMIPVEEMGPYASRDLELEEKLYVHCRPIITERGLDDLFQLEKETTQALFDMERAGFMLDREYVEGEYDRTTELLEGMEEQILEAAGREVNFNNPHDVKKIMTELGIKSTQKTGKGNESWSKAALVESDHPLASLIVNARAIYKMRGSYYGSFKERMDEEAVIHCNIYQSGARTGRMSCREPNLQNIPRFEGFTGAKAGAIAEGLKLRKKRDEAAKAKAEGRAIIEDEGKGEASALEQELFGKVRGSFIPRPGHFLAFFDWSQIELRIFAEYSGEDQLLEVFDYGLDVHRMTALSAFGTMPEDTKSNEFKWFRNMGKQIAFGLIYGMGKKLLAIEIGKSEDEAEKFMVAYFSRFRNAQRFIRRVNGVINGELQADRELNELGYKYIANRWDRRRYLSPDRAYVGVNFLVQGTAADLLKERLVAVHQMLKREGFMAQPLIPVHDEVIIEVPYHEAEELIPAVIAEMDHASRLKIPLKVDVEWSPTRWSEKRGLECKNCGGFGKTLNVDQDALLQAMYNSDNEFMDKVVAEKCLDCDGLGLDLTDIQEYREKRFAA